MTEKNTIRLSGSEMFVKDAGDIVIDIFRQKGYGLFDGGVRKSINPKYKGNYIRYIRMEEMEGE